MHELSVCQGLVDVVMSEAEAADPPARRITKTTVVVGALRQIVPEHLRSAYETLTEGTIAEQKSQAVCTSVA